MKYKHIDITINKETGQVKLNDGDKFVCMPYDILNKIITNHLNNLKPTAIAGRKQHEKP